MAKHSSIYCILGPTGVGKTDFSLALAAAVDGEIINCDVGQFYQPLSIGTAKPDWHNQPVPHYGFDIITHPSHFTVTTYRETIQNLLNELNQRNKSAILVGGSGFYFYSLFFPPQELETLNNEATSFENQSTEELWQKLFAIDPLRAEQITRNDRYRLERALNVWHSTGKLPSTLKPLYNPIMPASHIIHIDRDRNELYQRINSRTEIMLREGWINEVGSLALEWKNFLKIKKLIGYPEIIKLLEAVNFDQDSITDDQLENVTTIIQQKTRNYAKRQLCFWRMLQGALKHHDAHKVHELNLTVSTVDVYLNQLLSE